MSLHLKPVVISLDAPPVADALEHSSQTFSPAAILTRRCRGNTGVVVNINDGPDPASKASNGMP